MLTQKDFTEKINGFKDHAIASGLDPHLLSDMLAPLNTAINKYFSENITNAVSVCITALTHAQIRTGIVYVDGSTVGSDAGNEPTGYKDIRELFNVGAEILDTSNETFTNSIVEVTPEVTPALENGDTTVTMYYESSLVTSWLTEFSVAGDYLLVDLNKVAEYANSVGLGNLVKSVLEPSEIASVPSLVDIAKSIYYDHHYLELIKTWNLDIYVPSSCKEG